MLSTFLFRTFFPIILIFINHFTENVACFFVATKSRRISENIVNFAKNVDHKNVNDIFLTCITLIQILGLIMNDNNN